MNISKLLALRYIKRQKRRTIVTILGVILSVALFTSIGVMLYSIQNYQSSYQSSLNGSYDVIYEGVNSDSVEYLKNNYSVDKVGTALDLGNGFISKEEADKYALGDSSVRAYTAVYFDNETVKMTSVKLKEGIFPKQENQVLVPKILMNKGYRVNSKIKLCIAGSGMKKSQEKEFVISGFLDNDENIIYLSKDFSEEFLAGNKNYRVFVSLKNEADYKKSFRIIQKQIKCNNVSYNYTGMANKGKYMENYSDYSNLFVICLLGVVILIASALVIYSAFNISIFERIKEFGVLRAVGASRYQIKSIIFIESCIMIIVGIPIGILCGIAAIKILVFIVNLSKFNMFRDINIHISLSVIISGAVFGVLCIIFSSIVPVIKSGRINPIEAIKGFKKIKLLKHKRKHFKFIKGIKFETILIFRNIKRNKGRFRLVVLSIAVSITIFISFYSFVMLIFRNIGKVGYKRDMHISTTDITFKKEDIYDMKNIKGVKEIYPLEESSILIFCPLNRLSENFKKTSRTIHYKQGYFWDTYNIYFSGYDSNELDEIKDYVIKGKIDIDKLNKGEEVLVFEKVNSRTTGEVNETNLQIGDEIYIDNNNIYKKPEDYPKIDFQKLKKVKVGAVISKSIFQAYGGSSMLFISSLEGYKNIVGHNNFSDFEVELFKNADKKKVKQKIKSKLGVNYKYTLQDSEEIQKEYEESKIEVFILIYGFIGVISLIGILNIVNTVNTNLILRLKEFACLIAVGMSISDLKKMLLKEGILYGIYGTIYGMIFSSGLYYIIYKSILKTETVIWYMYAKEVIVSVISVIIIIFVSMIFPLKRIEKMNIIENMRGEE
ncbi:ABC transporter permease [Clostridium felsineum]|uniref:Uncharacterized protein n=1 Tax=Clostridium felsineum TaxID=36839 RepID=A0A1S8L8M8_9CLOT|nr:ABC transporter permease [Clostridium felsineum]MCR3759543.1 ABC transporter permease [Clostridium felsineum]URZ02196.1 hypothetical protein CLAUR_021930 [Clostridium felsineum]URZ05051.1 hypothetical protein CLROS_003750 [Clostridium felsineum]URZ10092.1 hypothetical protein CROST_008000 [Clostridium felsineum]